MAYVRERVCSFCSKVEVVRKDNKASICKSCSSRIAGAKGLASPKRKVKKLTCANCEKDMGYVSGKIYCSKSCRDSKLKTKRECKKCSKVFYVLRSSIKKSNSSGNFCSRDCYNEFLCNSKRVTGRGSRWKSIRESVLKKFGVCAVCGTTKNLQVHHIVPFRLTFDNSESNLIPLCVKHHKFVEMMTVDIENKFDGDVKTISTIMGGILRARQFSVVCLYNSLKRRFK